MKIRAFTLFEMLFVVSIVAIVSLLIVPNFNNLRAKQRVTVEVNALLGALNYARLLSISKKRPVTICGTLDGTHCSRSWSQEYMVFLDQNNDAQRDEFETMVFNHRPKKDFLDISWSAFGRKNYIRYLPTGITAHHNGTFKLCHEKLSLIRAISIAKSGRARASKDSDKDGIHELGEGKPIDC